MYVNIRYIIVVSFHDKYDSRLHKNGEDAGIKGKGIPTCKCLQYFLAKRDSAWVILDTRSVSNGSPYREILLIHITRCPGFLPRLISHNDCGGATPLGLADQRGGTESGGKEIQMYDSDVKSKKSAPEPELTCSFDVGPFNIRKYLSGESRLQSVAWKSNRGCSVRASKPQTLQYIYTSNACEWWRQSSFLHAFLTWLHYGNRA